MNDKVEDLGCLPNGCHLFRSPNDAGGHTYFSDEVGGGVEVWDTCLVNESTLLAAILCEQHRKYMEYMYKNGWKPQQDMSTERMAGTGESFIGPLENGSIDPQKQ